MLFVLAHVSSLVHAADEPQHPLVEMADAFPAQVRAKYEEPLRLLDEGFSLWDAREQLRMAHDDISNDAQQLASLQQDIETALQRPEESEKPAQTWLGMIADYLFPDPKSAPLSAVDRQALADSVPALERLVVQLNKLASFAGAYNAYYVATARYGPYTLAMVNDNALEQKLASDAGEALNFASGVRDTVSMLRSIAAGIEHKYPRLHDALADFIGDLERLLGALAGSDFYRRYQAAQQRQSALLDDPTLLL